MAKSERYETQPTHLEGVRLRREPGIEVDILKRTVEDLLYSAHRFNATRGQIDELAKGQEKTHQEIIEIAQKHRGLRGLVSEPDNIKLTVYPSDKVGFDADKLKTDLGEVGYAVVCQEEIGVTISVPAGLQTKKGIIITRELLISALAEFLKDLGFADTDLDMIMTVVINANVDEAKLDQWIKEGKAGISPEAKTVKTTWNVKVEQLEKQLAYQKTEEVEVTAGVLL